MEGHTNVTRQQLRQALESIEADGLAPSLGLIRERIGHGSMLEIVSLLKAEQALRNEAECLSKGLPLECLFLLFTGQAHVLVSVPVPAPDLALPALAIDMKAEVPSLELSYRAYVEQGLALPELLARRALVCMEALENAQDNEPGPDSPSPESLTKIAWFLAYAYAARRLDRGALALLYGETWLLHSSLALALGLEVLQANCKSPHKAVIKAPKTSAAPKEKKPGGAASPRPPANRPGRVNDGFGALLNIPGIGRMKAERLYHHFGSIEALLAANDKVIQWVGGIGAHAVAALRRASLTDRYHAIRGAPLLLGHVQADGLPQKTDMERLLGVQGVGHATAHALLRRFGSLGAILSARQEELMKVDGVGIGIISRLSAHDFFS